ncbi:hypothetical protein [Frateuria defendens]|uniref:hypothetical protein n=1 Tax=Frateuria defendens TaxID=2219559 RepID=UPI00066FCEA3|nr:hypothetical protein [Frateuria defendens]
MGGPLHRPPRLPLFGERPAPASATPEPPRRRSTAVPLLLAGTLGLGVAGCHSGTDVQRNHYANLQDCIRDYSIDQCDDDGPSGSSSSGGGYYHHGGGYHGPWYRSRASAQGVNGDPGPGRSGGVIAARLDGSGPRSVELGTRGGFGSSGRVSARGS